MAPERLERAFASGVGVLDHPERRPDPDGLHLADQFGQDRAFQTKVQDGVGDGADDR